MSSSMWRSRAGAFLPLLLALPLALALGGEAEGRKPSEPTPWTGPVPRAECGPDDRPESGLQGQTTRAERESGDSELGYRCNLELVGQYQGEGSKYQMAWFDDCAYFGTNNNPEQRDPGVVVVDASDPSNPRATAHLATPAMLDPHESLKVHERRKLLAAVENTSFTDPVPPSFAFDVYDLSGDCAEPELLASIDVPGSMGHAGNFSQDGMTYYGTATTAPGMTALDVSDPRRPELLTITDHLVHDLTTNKDGTRAYLAQIGNVPTFPNLTGPNGLVILDVGDIQSRRPEPQTSVVSRLYWEDGSGAQQAIPVTYRGRDHLIFTDESGAGGFGAGSSAIGCDRGLPPNGFARIIDISDERNPRTISKLMLEVNDPAIACPRVLDDPAGNNYSSHYCDVDKTQNPKMVACSWRDGGLRVFDIRDPYRPREVAYYKPPAMREAFLPGSNLYAPGRDRTVDHTPTHVRWRKHRGEDHLWFASQDNGFQIVRFTNDPLARRGGSRP